MAAGGFMIVKNILLLVTFLSLLAGLILIGGGAYQQSQASQSDVINLTGSISVAAIIIGLFITLVSFLGCFGAANEKGFLLKTYFAMLFVLILLEVSVGIAAYAKQDAVTRYSFVLTNRSQPYYKLLGHWHIIKTTELKYELSKILYVILS